MSVVSDSGVALARQRERRALRLSIIVSCGFALVAIVWGLITGSQVMLLDAIFTPVSLLATWAGLVVSKVASEAPTRRFPFGRDALIPLFVLAQALVMFAGLLYAMVEAVRVILEGGSDVSGLSLALYGAFGTIVCTGAWWMLRRMAHGQSLIIAEAAGWLSSIGSSVVIVVGGIAVLLLERAGWYDVTPFADSVLVLVSGIALAVVPISLVRRGVRELQTPRPDAAVVAQIDAVVDEVRRREGLPVPRSRLGRLGNTLMVELAFVLPPGTGDIDGEDRVRRGVTEGLAELPLQLWLLVEFTHDARLVD